MRICRISILPEDRDDDQLIAEEGFYLDDDYFPDEGLEAAEDDYYDPSIDF